MVRSQIQLPDKLFERVKKFSADREWSLAETARRALEFMLDCYPATPAKAWKFPVISNVQVKVPLEKLRDFSSEDEENRSR